MSANSQVKDGAAVAARALESGAGKEALSRRQFMRSLMWGSAGLFALEAALSGLALFWPRNVKGFGSTIRVGPLADFPVGSVTKVREGKFYVSRLENGFIALYWRCTHLGCTVPWREDEQLFHCPCHGSMYERTGQNIAGPAPRPLDYMESTVESGQIVVNTGKITQRERYEPGQLTPV
ncbi:hypothetical protein LIP_1511 [Limnochorda pilosa]|uniref:Rieske domain-containing protein n=1 Tax=Limnochorda pilosa TaxID=1555112 RepID=A0A0K2SKJ1_LIMPI|nr:hypothetical protein LIP_1511 [Limnochorda pilosa]